MHVLQMPMNVILFAKRVVAFINPTTLYDRFDTNGSAPLSTPRSAEPGPGSWTVTDPSSGISIASNRLTMAFAGAPSSVSGLAAVASHIRKAGRALFITMPTATFSANVRAGLHTSGTINSSLQYGVDLGGAGTTYRVKTGASATVNVIAPGTAPYELCFIERGIGAYLLVRSGGSGAWTLAYVWRTNSADLFPQLVANNAGTPTATFDDVYIVDLGDTSGANFFSDDYALASSRSAVSTADETKTMHAADSIVSHTITAQTGVTQHIYVRQQDSNNYWDVQLNQGASTIELFDIVAGVPNASARATAAQTWTNGTQYRVVVTCKGNTIRVVVDDGSEKWAYTSASAFNTATTARVSHAGVDFITWLSTITLTPPSP